MKDQFLERFAPLRETPRQEQNKFARRISRIGFRHNALLTTESALAYCSSRGAHPVRRPSPDAQKCAALQQKLQPGSCPHSFADLRSSLPRTSSKCPRVVWRDGHSLPADMRAAPLTALPRSISIAT